MKKFLIATSNQGKLSEYQEHLSDLGIELVSLKDVGLSSIDETGKTFEENAILKAKTYFMQAGVPCISDDGGLEIDALNGEPGVYSRRWKTGDENVTDKELIEYTLLRMKDVSERKRTARLRLVMAFADMEGNIHTTEAAVEGVISQRPAKNKIEGFPFRAVLYIPQFGKMYDDLTKEEHYVVNQRIAAIKKLKPIIRAKLI
jgi:XTP/dITP diphosphohydrolase